MMIYIAPWSRLLPKLLWALAALAVMLPGPARAEYDESRFCRADGTVFFVLIDVTSYFDAHARELFSDGIAKIFDHAEPGDQLIVQTIEEAFTSSKILYDKCMPYCENGGLFGWLFSECTDGLVTLRTREQRQQLIDALQGRLMGAGDLPNSEILRTLAHALQPVTGTQHDIELFIFSDLIENSQYIPGRVFWSEPRQSLLDRLARDQLVPELSRSQVRIFGVGRSGAEGRQALTQAQLNQLQAFWEAYFKAAGAHSVQINEALYFED